MTAASPEIPAVSKTSSRAGEFAVAFGLAALITVLGFPLGWLWSVIAPGVPVQIVAGVAGREAILTQPEQEQMIADEAWYLLITVVVGLLITALAWSLLRRYRGVLMLLGLALGGVLGGVLTLRFGHNIGQHRLHTAPVGTFLDAPVNLRIQHTGLWHGWLPYARGDVLALAIAATVLYLLLAGFSAYPSLREAEPEPLTQPAAAVGYPAAAQGYAPPPAGYPAPPNGHPPAYGPPAAYGPPMAPGAEPPPVPGVMPPAPTEATPHASGAEPPVSGVQPPPPSRDRPAGDGAE